MSTIIRLYNKTYCAFCGKEITHDNDGQLLCQCNDAKEYRKALSIKFQLELEASKVMANAPKPKYAAKSIIVPITDCEAFEDDSCCVPTNPL